MPVAAADPLANWKARRNQGRFPFRWIAAAGGVAIIGLALAIMFVPGDSGKATSSSAETETPRDVASNDPKPTPTVEPPKQLQSQTSVLPDHEIDRDPEPNSRVADVVPTHSETGTSPKPILADVPKEKNTPHVTTSPSPSIAAVTPASSPPAKSSSAGAIEYVNRSRAEVLALVTSVGRTPPDWYEATPLNYPKTLDLSFPQPPPDKAWNNQKNVGQFIWDIINPNPGRWQEGVRLMHHLLLVNKDNRATLGRIMAELGRMYHELLQDYPRAAFWYQQAGIGQGSQFERSKNGAHLAECYWRLGNRAMAIELLEKLPVTFESIKLWGDLGETEKSVSLAKRAIPNAQFPAQLHLMIGDAYRLRGDYREALRAYQDALSEAKKGGHARQNTLRLRAGANIAAIQAVELLDLAKVPDGAYRSSSIGYEGPIEVEVRILRGRIEDVRVTKHKEKQFYSSIEDTPRKIIEQQGIKNVDATSGATITSEAIINATAKALAAAMKS